MNILQVLSTALRIDPEQRFTCASCARCCRRHEIVVTPDEVESLRRRDAGQWFRAAYDAPAGAHDDPFTPLDDGRGYHLVRKGAEGACGFLSPTNRCRLHEELGADAKPLTCRAFPFSFYHAPGTVVVTASFTCPTVVANHGDRIASGTSLDGISSLWKEWFAGHHPPASPRQLIPGRTITPASIAVLRDGLLTILDRTDGGARDLRLNVRRMAMVFDDLTRARVLRLPDADFAEYVKLTIPFAAASTQPVPMRAPTRLARLLQRGFLFTVVAARERVEQRRLSRFRTVQLLAHVHGVAPPVGRVNMAALKSGRLDLNAPEIQPTAHHYLRASLHAMGASERPVLDAFAIAVSYLNAARALAVMNGTAGTFAEALMEAVDLSHADEQGMLGRWVGQLTGGTEALYTLGTTGS